MTDQNTPPAPVAGDTGADAGPVATVFPAWKSFSVEKPPEDAALDDPSCKTTRVVLVTNNLKARNRMGQMSHLWLARPIKGSDGEWCAYTDGDQKIHALTHWFDPFGAPADAVSKDAERYRFISGYAESIESEYLQWGTSGGEYGQRDETLDAAVDAAMAATQEAPQ